MKRFESATVATTTEIYVLQKASEKQIVHLIFASSSSSDNDLLKTFPTIRFVPKIDIQDLIVLAYFCEVFAPDGGAWNAVTDKVNHNETVVVLAKVGFESTELARRTRVEHPTPLSKKLPGLDKRVADAALHILAPHKRLNALKCLRIIMHHLPVIIKTRPEDHSALLYCPFCQSIKDTARRTLHTDVVVAVDSGISTCGGLLRNSNRIKNGAYAFALMAGNARLRVDMRLQEALAVFTHSDTMARTSRNTSRTACTRGCGGEGDMRGG